MTWLLHRLRTETARADRGASLVEFSLIAVLIVTLLLGTITMGLSFNRDISLNNSARESSRYGATLPVEGDLAAWLNSVADVAIETAAGDLAPGTAGQEICVAYVYPEGASTNDRTMSLIESDGARTLSAGVSCFSDSRPNSERRVQVRVERESDVDAAVFSKTVKLTAQSIVRFERT